MGKLGWSEARCDIRGSTRNITIILLILGLRHGTLVWSLLDILRGDEDMSTTLSSCKGSIIEGTSEIKSLKLLPGWFNWSYYKYLGSIARS